ncbi:MAG: alpha/beta hydrolase [Pseudomonadota bacterium]
MGLRTILLVAAAFALSLIPVRPAAAEQASRTDQSATVEDVSIQSTPGVILAATIRVPVGKGPRPILILQSGSGRSKRGGYVPLEHRLNDVGIATIEFDKRGVGQSTGKFTDTMQDMEVDLEATIAWARKRADIDGNRIALLGHSQGAAAVPEVADRDGHLAAVVFLAGPVGQRGTMFLERMRAQLVEGGRAPDIADQVIRAAHTWMEDRSRGASAAEIAKGRAAVVAKFQAAGFTAVAAEEATKVLDSPQLLSMYQVAPGTALSRLRIPVLAVFGARDEIVGAQASAATSALADNPKALVIEVPGANHGFGYRRADVPPRANTSDGPWLSLLPKALITDWLREWLVDRPQVDDWRVR